MILVKNVKTIADVLEDLKDLSRVLSYKDPQITDNEVVKRLEKDIAVIEQLQPLIEQFQLEAFNNLLKTTH